MACASRAVGFSTNRCVQVVPFHSQVSTSELPPALPPNSTVTLRTGSKANAVWYLPEGPLVERRVHAVPSYSQVWLGMAGGVWRNWPNRTTFPRAESYVIEWPLRAEGPAITRCVHVDPFHSHVSPSVPPPNSTVT